MTQPKEATIEREKVPGDHPRMPQYFYSRERAKLYCGCSEVQFDEFIKYGLLPDNTPWWLKVELDKALAKIDVCANVIFVETQVYFIACERFIKIGFSGSAHGRLASLQTSTPFELTMLGYFFGTEICEALIHDIFKKDRHRGEWFNSSPALLAYIEWIQARTAPR